MRLFDQLLWKLVGFNVASNGHRCECEYMAEQRTALDRAERLLAAVFITEIFGGGESTQKTYSPPKQLPNCVLGICFRAGTVNYKYVTETFF